MIVRIYIYIYLNMIIRIYIYIDMCTIAVVTTPKVEIGLFSYTNIDCMLLHTPHTNIYLCKNICIVTYLHKYSTCIWSLMCPIASASANVPSSHRLATPSLLADCVPYLNIDKTFNSHFDFQLTYNNKNNNNEIIKQYNNNICTSKTKINWWKKDGYGMVWLWNLYQKIHIHIHSHMS